MEVTKDYQIPEYGEEIKVERKLLTVDDIELIGGFRGDPDDVDFLEFLKEYAIDETISRTYIYRNTANGEAVAFCSLSCSTIAEEKNDGLMSYAPAILVDKFMVDLRYRHIQYFRDNDKHVLASMIFLDMIEYIEELVKKVIGAQYIVLYSVQEAHNFYRNRCDMEDFKEYMRRTNDFRTNDCIPMFWVI